VRQELRGIIAELVTPYNGYGGIDTDGVGALVERAIAGGVAAILLNGPIGEGPHLSRGERIFVLEAAIEATAGRVPLYAATGAVGAEETLALTWDAGKVGIAAVFIAPPFYYRLSQAALVAHYRAIARRARLPIVVHNIPSSLGNTLTPDSLAEAATIDGVAAIAQADPDFAQFTETLRLLAGRLPLLAARDAVAYPALDTGAAGLVSATAGLVPSAVVALGTSLAAGARDDARRRWLDLQRFNRFLDEPGAAVAACKAALTVLGLPGGAPRAPLPPLDKATQALVQGAIASLPGATPSAIEAKDTRLSVSLSPASES
jgi:4-hydroxy-tetrahydrodipicolinate synthase